MHRGSMLLQGRTGVRSSSRVRKTVQAINNNPENFESDESPDLVSDSDDSEDSESSDSDDDVSLNQLKAKRAEKPSKKVLKRRRQVANQKRPRGHQRRCC